ncbi:MAG: translation initiation factor IF-3 [Chloroflexi bacterium]|nr:translation initiation factor IF-3 [Chloroflexota bacterium]
MIKQYRINERIRAREVRVIGEDGKQLGVMPMRQALQLARDSGYDLVEVAPEVQPPVCRILDYGKFKYELAKKERDARKKQKIIEVRQVRLRPKTEEHDVQFKIGLVLKLLDKGDKVKVMMVFRGREITHPMLGRRILDQMVKALAGKVVLEKSITMEGNSMSVILAPLPAKGTPKKEPEKKEPEKKEPEKGKTETVHAKN